MPSSAATSIQQPLPPQPSGMLTLRVDSPTSKTAALTKIPIPELSPTDVLIKVHVAILAPDVFNILSTRGLSQAPTTIGHKVSGTIHSVGSAIIADPNKYNGLKPGVRVRLDPNLSCGECGSCRSDRDHMCDAIGTIGFFSLGTAAMSNSHSNGSEKKAVADESMWSRYHPGGLAEYVRASVSHVDVLPDSVSFEAGAKVHDLANAVRALKMCELTVGSTLLVTAATGAMGTSVVKMAGFFGVGRLILVGRKKGRVDQAVKLAAGVQCECIGVDELGDKWIEERGLGNRVKEIAGKEGVDAVIDFAPEGTEFWQVLDGLKVGGTVIPMGGNWSVMPIPARVIGLKCWRVQGTRNHSRGDSKIVLELLRNKRLSVDELVSHEYGLKDVEEAVHHLMERKESSWMVVIRP